MGDMQRVFAWRNSAEILTKGSLGKTVEWDEHETWFTESVEGDMRQLYVVEVDGEDSGSVRFDQRVAGTSVISVYMLPVYQGRGHGVHALIQGCDAIWLKWGRHPVIAFVRKENPNAVTAFTKAGFVESGLLKWAGHRVLEYV